MPPGSETVLNAAAQRGYEAVVVCLALLLCFATIGVLIKWFIRSLDSRTEEVARVAEARAQEAKGREDRMANRIAALEKFVEDTLVQMVREASTAIKENTLAVLALQKSLEKRTLCPVASEKE